ncbi:MAG: cycloinulo-oligosaccharide fructanotransferase, partial [Armatimonadetes bacterium]|nr:cycloinulo-oligosaccharide fructanotransferase [Armatimonadota bacterium]
ESNLPLTGSKPYCGKLSTGQRYLIANTVRHPQRSRAPLTIAVSRPGEKLLCRVFRIRDARRPGAGDEVDKNLCYPHAVEYDGKLYVIYSAGVGSNLNDCELALIPIEALAVE